MGLDHFELIDYDLRHSSFAFQNLNYLIHFDLRKKTVQPSKK